MLAAKRRSTPEFPVGLNFTAIKSAAIGSGNDVLDLVLPFTVDFEAVFDFVETVFDFLTVGVFLVY